MIALAATFVLACAAGAGQDARAPSPAQADGTAELLAEADAVRATLEREAPDLALQRRAFDLALALVARGEERTAAALQRALHARAQAPWSAHDLAQTLAHLGEVDEADAVLAAALARWPRDGVLWNERALIHLGVGDVARAWVYLGAALRSGELGARQTLGRLAFVGGDPDAARAAWRPAVDAARAPDTVPSDWALRGWALTLLPPRP